MTVVMREVTYGVYRNVEEGYVLRQEYGTLVEGVEQDTQGEWVLRGPNNEVLAVASHFKDMPDLGNIRIAFNQSLTR